MSSSIPAEVPNTPPEEWRVCIQFTKYECSNLGRIRNRQTKRIKGVKENDGGYLIVYLSDNGYPVRDRTVKVSRLIAATFIDNTLIPLQIGERFNKNTRTADHLNNNLLDNRVENLRIITASENSLIKDRGWNNNTKISRTLRN